MNAKTDITKPNLPSYAIRSSDGVMLIMVPQCCGEWANVCIGYSDEYKSRQFGNGSITRQIDLAIFEEPYSPFATATRRRDMPESVYRKYLSKNKQAILDLVHELNAK